MIKITIISLVVIILIATLVGCQSFIKNKEVFKWGATESAPIGYPMEIVQGKFYIKDGEGKALSVPSGGTIDSGWGYPISSHGRIEDKLPEKLSIIFYSWTENQFYRGDFDLPYDEMVAHFQEAVAKLNPNIGGLPFFDNVMVGVAPGGSVAVWVKGSRAREVFFGQAKKIDINPNIGFNFVFEDQADVDDYIKQVYEGTLSVEEREAIIRDGIPFDLWSRLRQKFDWAPINVNNYRMSHFNIWNANGEYEENYNITLDDFYQPDNKRYIPKTLGAAVRMPNHKKLQPYHARFDHLETITAFETLYAHPDLTDAERKIYIEFDYKDEKEKSTVRVFNAAQSIVLTKTTF